MAQYKICNGVGEQRGIYRPTRRRSRYRRNADPLRFSRRAAVCEWCGKRYENLHRSIAETAKNARQDGWQIEYSGDHWEWYCPECKAVHDFADIPEISNSGRG